IIAAALFFTLSFVSIMAATADHITGRVTDEKDGSPIAGAAVMIGIKGVVTNADGYYSMPLPDKKSGNVVLKFSCLSYLKRNVTVTLPIKDRTQVNVSLTPDENMLSEAVVQGSRHDFGVKSPQMSAIELSGAQLKAVPMVFGEPDLLKTIQRLPGVQSGKEGNSGIMVRGGGYDQNQLMLDGAMLYSTEHMKGFVTAVNPDMISSMAFYRGAFPAKYGGRLSSVIDVATTEGDYHSYHGAISAGLMVGRVNVSGPIVKGKTSFALAGRLSYFDLIFQPEAEKHYKKIGVESPYTGMEFWDINLKLAHRFSAKDKMTMLVLTDRDRQKTETTKNYPKTNIAPYYDPDELPNLIQIGDIVDYSYSTPSKTSTRWGNILGALNWYHRFGDNHRLHTSAAYSAYSYEREYHGEQESSRTIVVPQQPDSVPNSSREVSDITHRSKVSSFNFKSDYQLPLGNNNTINAGIELKHITTDPRRKIVSDRDEFEDWSIWQEDYIIVDMRDIHRHTSTDTLVGKVSRMFNGNIYLSDHMKYGPFEAIIGARVASYSVKNKTYMSFEPRLSASVMLDGNSSIKASVSRMSQGERLLSSTSLVSPSDVWIGVTDSIPPMKSMTYSVSLNRQLPWGMEASLEGYYKTIDNMTDYREGSDFSRASTNWENMIALGKGKAYGVEFLLQRMTGNTTGWISYTWSKAISRFDRPGQVINSGRDFYSPGDRRNNLSVNLTHRVNINRYPGNHFDISAAFFYATGRRVTIPDHLTYAGMLAMADHTVVDIGLSSHFDPLYNIPTSYSGIVMPSEAFDVYMRYEGYAMKNNLELPYEMRLDISMAMTVKHLIGESTFTVGATNLLNRKNLSDAFIGTTQGGTLIVKGVCNFPLMPTISYTYSF
ncbi:MAG: TonB-dependent receptor, partial [Muribaculaceae bacterium]|nr:TonB-dependent receptor [Muribaculaceae bacterium]